MKPKSRVLSEARYTAQWFWCVPLAALWVVPYALYWGVVSALPSTLAPRQDPGPPGSGRRFRWRRRMWLGRARLRRECSADVTWLEDCYRARLDGRKPVFLRGRSKGTVWRHPDGTVEIDDSYYRQFGVPRALAIAAECGYAPAGDAPPPTATWLVLRRAESAGHS